LAPPGIPNPFANIFLIAGRVPGSSDTDPRYQKSYWDLAFIAYYVVFWSFVRQSLSSRVSQPIAWHFGIRKPAKMDRFCEQAYALIYFTAFGAWGWVSPTWSLDYFFSCDACLSASCLNFQLIGFALNIFGSVSIPS